MQNSSLLMISLPTDSSIQNVCLWALEIYLRVCSQCQRTVKIWKLHRHKLAPVSASGPEFGAAQLWLVLPNMRRRRQLNDLSWNTWKLSQFMYYSVLVYLHHLRLRTGRVHTPGLGGFSSFQSQACKIFVLRIYTSLCASCSTHLMSAFDKSANSEAHGSGKLHLTLGGKETSLLVLCHFNWGTLDAL